MQFDLKKYEHIVNSLNYFKFGLFIEVTNGIHPNSIKEKTLQAKKAQNFFKSSCGDLVVTKTGIVYIKNYENIRDKALDFYFKINNYENRRLKKIIGETLNSEEMHYNDKILLEEILQISEKEACPVENFINPNKEAYYIVKRKLDMEKNIYDRKISDIKGTLLENYVADIFKEQNVDRVFTRVEYPFKNKKKKDIDLILISSESKMKEIIKNVKNRYCQ